MNLVVRQLACLPSRRILHTSVRATTASCIFPTSRPNLTFTSPRRIRSFRTTARLRQKDKDEPEWLMELRRAAEVITSTDVSGLDTDGTVEAWEKALRKAGLGSVYDRIDRLADRMHRWVRNAFLLGVGLFFGRWIGGRNDAKETKAHDVGMSKTWDLD
ncbi:uncharacterized protein LY89DRAFT_785828 [Mollisia scopiformis]|uniref:Uncharacterized protein n=1 Tax=Mollisia scopiformis TaxID=149040 RepID=A0A194WX13_MOLSC|nr:uncharacterized protein LY89DRAFT_785828 [Mollisia scopiformis]KUJ12475.1 hypothetical protein LY89DRAFT_785828 [Mollisia scopiformis]